MPKKIAITTTTFGEYSAVPFCILKKHGFEAVSNPYGRKLKRKEILELCGDVAGIIAGTETLDGSVLGKLPFLKVISRCGAGTDSIDLSAARKLGIKIFNTPDAPTVAVSELTVGLMLDLCRKISTEDRDLRGGVWKKRMGNLLSGKRVGIIGLGRIGRMVARLLKSFDCEIAYADPFVKQSSGGLKRLSLEKLLAWSHIVSLHISGKEKIIGARELRLMKKGAYLINTSRGSAIDEKAIHKALKNNRLAGAALDVFQNEPYEGPLKTLENVILTPHVGSYAKEARVEMETQAAENLIKGLKGQVD